MTPTSVPVASETMRSGLLMVGTRYQTPYFIKKGPQSGPTVVIVGGCHGDEPAGYLAARRLKDWRVQKGTLVLVPDANIEAIRRQVRFVGRNMNRLFPGNPGGDGLERLASEIWTLIKQSKPQLVLTLHESRDFYAKNPSRYGQTFTFDFDELRPQFGPVTQEVNTLVEAPSHRFLLKVEAFPTCPTYCTWKFLHVPATSIETSKTLPLPTRIRYQLAACRAFFHMVGLGIEQRP